MKTNFNTKMYVKREDNGKFWIEETTLEDLVRDSAKETTSPRGVEPKLFVEENEDDSTWELRIWEVNGRSRLVDSFESEEEAHQEWLERTYEYDYNESELDYISFTSVDDLINDIVESTDGEMTREDVVANINDYEAERIEIGKAYVENTIKDWNNLKNVAESTGTTPKKMGSFSLRLLNRYMNGNPYSAPIPTNYPEEFVNDVKSYSKF